MTKHQRLTRTRLRRGLALITCVLLVFGVRLFQIQGIDSGAYAALAKSKGTSKTVLPATRGSITDRNGADLATSVDAVAITADPSMTTAQAPAIAAVLVEQLDGLVDYFTMVDKLRTAKTRFVYLAHQVPRWKASNVTKELRKRELAGVFTEAETSRSYPGGTLAANLLGYLDASGTGVAGLERQYDKELTGKDGSATYETSPSGERIPLANSSVVPMVPGKDVVTTIDRDLQWYADQRLADAVRTTRAGYGLAITMDVKTGEIVQYSQVPTYDADSRDNMSAARTVNRAVQNVYEPGSVQKTITMAALADQGKINAKTKIKVPGSLTIDKFKIGDYWDHGTLRLTAAGVIAKSSNLGTIVAAQQMSDQTMHDYLAKFGFGQKTGVGLPGESRGLLRDADTWSDANHATIAFGQGISVTAVQMVAAVGTIANGGVWVQPSVVKSEKAPETRRVVSKKAAKIVTRMMEAVTADDGTAPSAQIPGYRVAGKTGTAWRVNPDTGRYVRGQNTVSFMGFAPADEPRFLTYIVLDNPRGNASGGLNAAPVFKDIMAMALERFGVVPTGSKAPKTAQEW
ncbi:cell division protein FtsI [soil metagenome]